MHVTSETFRLLLVNFFRNGRLKKSDKFLSLISPGYLLKRNSGIISRQYRLKEPDRHSLFRKEIKVENYTGSNAVTKKISDILKLKAGDLLAGAYVHGSIGTSEEVRYSDFDGLVIINNTTLENPAALFRAVKALKETEKFMYEMDPLQHHGWFVMSEADLDDYPQHYFPHELFGYAKCLWGSNAFTIQLRDTGYQTEYNQSFERLIESILKKLHSKSFLENYYSYKNLLSEFMLLPSLYIQSKTGKGVYKKFSFELLEKEMGNAYLVMNDISRLRQSWNFTPPPGFVEKRKSGGLLSKNHIARTHSGKVEQPIVEEFNTSLIVRMTDFVNDLKYRLQK